MMQQLKLEIKSNAAAGTATAADQRYSMLYNYIDTMPNDRLEMCNKCARDSYFSHMQCVCVQAR